MHRRKEGLHLHGLSIPDGHRGNPPVGPGLRLRLAECVPPDQAEVDAPGTRIDCLAHFDNSPENPGQPRPDSDGVVGQSVVGEEMMTGYIDYAEDLPAAGSVRPVSATRRHRAQRAGNP